MDAVTPSGTGQYSRRHDFIYRKLSPSENTHSESNNSIRQVLTAGPPLKYQKADPGATTCNHNTLRGRGRRTG